MLSCLPQDYVERKMSVCSEVKMIYDDKFNKKVSGGDESGRCSSSLMWMHVFGG